MRISLTALAALIVSACAAPSLAQTNSGVSADLDADRARAIVQGGAVVPRRPSGCVSQESRQLDFWVGEWDVSPGASQVIIAESVVVSQNQGCTIIANWRPFRNAHGHSINAFDAREGKWRQMWSDAGGRVLQYAGALDESGVMRMDNLTAAAGIRERMSIQNVSADTVRQWSEHFDADRAGWVTDWDFTYRRRARETRQ